MVSGITCRCWQESPVPLHDRANCPLPSALGRVKQRLGAHADGDRQIAGILSAARSCGLDASKAAGAEALAGGAVSRDVVLNIPAPQREPSEPAKPKKMRAVELFRSLAIRLPECCPGAY